MRLHRRETVPTRELRSAQIGNVVLYGTFGLLMFGPLAFGAVEPWSIFIVETGALLLSLLWLAKQWIDEEISLLWNPLFLPMSVYGALIGVQLIFKISAYPHESISEALQYCAYAMLCFLATQTMIRSSQARKIAVMLAFYGFAVAAFALLQGISPNGRLYWVRLPRMGGWIYGPYVNHNHYAGLMEMLVPIPLVISLSHLAHEKERIAAGVAAAVMVGTIFLSGSRGGMLAVFVELVVLATILLRTRKGMKIAIATASFAMVLISLLTWLGGKELTNRVSSISTEARTELSGGMRLSIDRDVFRMFRERPLFGWGLGTFPVVYPHFRSFYTNFFVNEAHNDYLQLLSEMGIAGVAVMIWFLALLFRRVRLKIRNWTSDVSGAMTLACTLGIIGILVHSFLDFNLQVPANAALFYTYCGIAAGPALLQRSRKPRPASNEVDEMLPASEVV